MEAESAVLVGVEEADEAVRLSLADTKAALVAEEVDDLVRADEGIAVAVEALEGRVGGEVGDAAEPLTGRLKALLSVADRDQEVLEVAL